MAGNNGSVFYGSVGARLGDWSVIGTRDSDRYRGLAAFKAQVSRVEPQKQQQELLEKQFKSLERKIKLFRTRPITVLLDKAAPEQGFNQQQFFSFKAVTTDKIHLLNQQGKKVGIVDINASRFPLAEIQDWSWFER